MNLNNMQTERHEESGQEARLVSALYVDLCRMAAYRLRSEPAEEGWSPASLVSETYVRIVSAYGKSWAYCESPMALWSRAMSNVLVDHARARLALKRQWGKREALEDTILPAMRPNMEVRLAVRAAFRRATASDPRKGAAIRLTVVHGLTIDEAASMLKVAPRTAKRYLRSVKVAMREQLQ